jgi:urease accessory protein
MMAGGGVIGVSGIKVPFVELGIAASVIVLGAIVALSVRAPVAIAMGLVGLFAIFHGYAHGSEMPNAASAPAYAVGFMLATALLHMIGIALGILIGRIGAAGGRLAFRLTGGLVALAGVVLLTNA